MAKTKTTPKIKTPKNTADKMSPKQKKKVEELEFAQTSVSGDGIQLGQQKYKTTRIDKNSINRYYNDPQKNYLQLQSLSNYFYSTNGMYQTLIDHFAYLPKYCYSIIPIGNLLQPKQNVDMTKYFMDNALRVQMLDIKKNSSRFALDLWLNGECFYYKHEDKKGILYQRIENKVCQPFRIENINGQEVVRYAINMKSLNVNEIISYPLEIQEAYKLFVKNPKLDIFVDETFYIVSNKGFCLTLNPFGRGIPPIGYALGNLLDIDEKKELQDKVDIINSTKMIHSKIPYDSKSGKPIVEAKLAKAYNDAIKSQLVDRNLEDIFAITNPFEPSILNLDTAKNNNAKSMVKIAKSDFYDEVGSSEFLFNSDKGGTEMIKRSVIEDTSRAINKILFILENYFTSELDNVKGHIKYKVSMKEITHHNETEKIAQSKEGLAYGFPVLEHYANLGYTPLESINSILLEKELGLKEILQPVQTSHTQSSSDNKGGNKSADEMRADGETVSDKTEAKESSGNDYS